MPLCCGLCGLQKWHNVYSEFWGSKFKNEESTKGMEDNVALYTDGRRKPGQKNNSWKKFKGTCSWCGIQGHKSVDCYKQKNAEKTDGRVRAHDGGGRAHNGGRRVQEDQKKCYRCKEKGHIAKNCPGKKRNAADAFFVRMVLSGEDANNNGDNSDLETERERAINNLSMEARL